MLRKSANIILALLMVVLTTGFTVSRHFCHERVRSTGIFMLPEGCSANTDAQGCCSALNKPHCKSEKSVKDNCCRFENTFVKFLTQFTVSKVASLVSVAVPGCSVAFSEPFRIEREAGFIYVNHSPPVFKEILLLIQSFLL